MKTNYSLPGILKIWAVLLIFFVGTAVVNAQPRGKDKNHRKEYKQSYKKENKNSYRHNDRRNYSPRYSHERVYVQRAPWGSHRTHVYSHNKGKIYYHRGHYYEYYPSRGYCVIDAPVGYHFEAVPPGFRRVWIDNTWCYHRDNLYLRPSVHGFISFQRPGISIGASF